MASQSSPTLCGGMLVRHADGDPGGAVRKQVRKCGGKNDGFAFFTVIGIAEVDGVFVNSLQKKGRHGG